VSLDHLVHEAGIIGQRMKGDRTFDAAPYQGSSVCHQTSFREQQGALKGLVGAHEVAVHAEEPWIGGR
jgi:hypothetical protein